ncbi:hypothetical protein [Neobacillus drentensis]|uniref:hypothetical protein n=1 Tax=Neobacillus drentensis TaxID=220684 RepID=UPI002859201F|nr:hypothetical protein [Neobacillus drentensis]MDR7237128.1 hypothetical protein [Neobacillus drentensis]
MANFYTGGIFKGDNLAVLHHKETVLPLSEIKKLENLALLVDPKIVPDINISKLINKKG